MSDEDLLRSGLATLTLDQPPASDRVGAVRGRIRRRAQRRAAAVGALVAVGLLGTAALVVPGEGGRDSLPAQQTSERQAENPDFRLRITQAVVTLPGTPYEEALERVVAALEPLRDLPNRTGRGLDENARKNRVGPVRVDFVRALDTRQREDVRAALARLDGAAVEIRDLDGFDLELVAPMSPQVLAGLQEGQELPPTVGTALADALDGIYGVSRSGDEVIVSYTGPALSDARVEAAVRAMAGFTGADVEDVRLRAGTGGIGSRTAKG